MDDRSTDRTGEIAREFAARDSRLRVLTNDHLPAGWTGKTYVLQRAADQSRGDWLWFLDADTVHAPEFLGVMMEYARSHRASLVSLLPELKCETFWEQLVQPLGGIVLMQSFPLDKVNDDRSKLAFANGQSILVERQAYLAAGGHEAVRDRFVEDIGMAQKVKALGLPIRTALVRGLVTCRMYASLGQLVRGWSRILYDALDRNPWRLLGRLLDPIVFCQSGHVALLAAIVMIATGSGGLFAYWLLGLSLLHHVLMYPVFRLVYHTSVPGSKYVPWFPLANLLIDYILIRSIKMCLTGRVTWRGTSYGTGTMTTDGWRADRRVRPVSRSPAGSPSSFRPLDDRDLEGLSLAGVGELGQLTAPDHAEEIVRPFGHGRQRELAGLGQERLEVAAHDVHQLAERIDDLVGRGLIELHAEHGGADRLRQLARAIHGDRAIPGAGDLDASGQEAGLISVRGHLCAGCHFHAQHRRPDGLDRFAKFVDLSVLHDCSPMYGRRPTGGGEPE